MGQLSTAFLVIDRKGEYVRDTQDQRGNSVPGMHHHPAAPERMIVVSDTGSFAEMAERHVIREHLPLQFNLTTDVLPIDLADFFPTLTSAHRAIFRDYGYVDEFYAKLLKENALGYPDKGTWFQDWPGLVDLKAEGKRKLKDILSDVAAREAEGGDAELTPEEEAQLEAHHDASSTKAFENGIRRIKRLCNNPLFGNSARGAQILRAPTSLPQIVEHLKNGRFVFVDMLGHNDAEYVLVAALLVRRLLNVNKELVKAGKPPLRCCIVLEEAQNILAEEELRKGDSADGSVFIELAREGRTLQLGEILVTQQPDPQSIGPTIGKTMDAIVAFNMPPDDAKYLSRFKIGFAGLETLVSNLHPLDGIAIARGGPVHFRLPVVDEQYMQSCMVANGLTDMIAESAHEDRPGSEVEHGRTQRNLPTVKDRLAELARLRRESIQSVALETMRIWQSDAEPDQDPVF